MNFFAYFFTALFSLSSLAMDINEDEVIEMRESGFTLKKAIGRLNNLNKKVKKSHDEATDSAFSCGESTLFAYGAIGLPTVMFGTCSLLEFFVTGNNTKALMFGCFSGGSLALGAATAGIIKKTPAIKQCFRTLTDRELRNLIEKFETALENGDRSLTEDEIMSFLEYAQYSDLKLFSFKQATWVFNQDRNEFDEIANYLNMNKTNDNVFNCVRIYQFIKAQVEAEAKETHIAKIDLALIGSNEILGAKVKKLFGGDLESFLHGVDVDEHTTLLKLKKNAPGRHQLAPTRDK